MSETGAVEHSEALQLQEREIAEARVELIDEVLQHGLKSGNQMLEEGRYF